MPYHLYVSISGEDKILIFTVNPQTGRLKLLGEVVVAGRPVPMAIDPSHQFVYVGRIGDRKISTYRRNWETGELLLIGTISLEADPYHPATDPVYMATDRKGRFLLSTFYNAGKVAVHAIDSDGILGTPPVEWLDTARGAHSIQTDPSNRFVFVPHTAFVPHNGSKGPNVILQFNFNEVTGHLIPNTPDRVIPDEGVGPRHFCFHPNLDIVYFCNEQVSSVTAYRFDSSVGTLNAFQTTSTLPDDYKDKSGCAEIQISPSGGFLYTTNRGHNSIACFSVHAYTGHLTPIGQIPTEANPRAFSLDPEGNFLFAAGVESGRLASYRVNRETGELKLLETYAVGKSPMWVLITRATR